MIRSGSLCRSPKNVGLLFLGNEPISSDHEEDKRKQTLDNGLAFASTQLDDGGSESTASLFLGKEKINSDENRRHIFSLDLQRAAAAAGTLLPTFSPCLYKLSIIIYGGGITRGVFQGSL